MKTVDRPSPRSTPGRRRGTDVEDRRCGESRRPAGGADLDDASGEQGIAFDVLATAGHSSVNLDERLRERWTRTSDRETTAWLIWRYGSPALLSLVEESLERRWACAHRGGADCVSAETPYRRRNDAALPAFDRRGGCVVAPFDLIARSGVGRQPRKGGDRDAREPGNARGHRRRTGAGPSVQPP